MKIAPAVATLLAVVALPANAGWVLDNDASRINFVSTKANTAAEVHTFGIVDGMVSDEGKASVSIDLETVDTAIEIRDERMRSMLFDTESYPTATIDATVDPEEIEALKIGDTVTTTAEGELSLHGTTTSVTLELSIARLSESRLIVSSYKPLVINAGQVGLAEGVEKLREVAGLPSISPAVPVSFLLVFDRDE